jgi:predicted phosphodiesterase
VRFAIFADVHANLPALEKFVEVTRSKVDGYVCLGDVVNYGPWNDECIELVWSLPNVTFLEGNHERLFLGTETVSEELPLVQTFFAHSRARFSLAERIRALPERHALGPYTCVHTIEGNRRIYPDSDLNLDANYVIGHSHHQFRRQNNGFEIVNCGSVGQNRGLIDLVQYAIYDLPGNKMTLHSEPYPVDLFIDQLEALHYPEECIAYYRGKKRSR